MKGYLYLGDNFIVGGIESLVTEFSVVRPDPQIMLTQVANPWAFGVAELDPAGRSGRVDRLVWPPATVVVTGEREATVRSIEGSWLILPREHSRGTSEKRTAKRLGAGVSDVDEEVGEAGEAAGELR